MCGSRAAPDSEKDTGDMLKDAVDNPESGIISIEKDIRMEAFGACLPSNRRRLHRRRPRLHPLMGDGALCAYLRLCFRVHPDCDDVSSFSSH